nr:retrovirus-related Pol polyprotein from transposon TNT 1-94 [Tanacetum cinerariifolium]
MRTLFKSQDLWDLAVEESIFSRIAAATSSNEVWTILKTKFQGSSKVSSIVSQMRSYGEKVTDEAVVAKMLRSLDPKFHHVVAAIEESKDLSVFSFDELMGSLQAHEAKYAEEEKEESYLFMKQADLKECVKDIWYIDSGCSNHITGNRSKFERLDESEKSQIRLGDDKQIKIEGRGTAMVMLNSEKKLIPDVHFASCLAHNLLSVGQLMETGHSILFDDGKCVVTNKITGKAIAHAYMSHNRMFPLVFSSHMESAMMSNTIEETKLWHLRYGHLYITGLKLLRNKHMVNDLPDIWSLTHVCEGCALGKQAKSSFPVGKSKRANDVLELIHADLYEPMKSESLAGKGVATAVYLLNISPTKAVWDQTPYEVWTGSKPSVSHLRHGRVPRRRFLVKGETKSLMILFAGDPITLEEAFEKEEWIEAMKDELVSIHQNQTWELVDPPEGKNEGVDFEEICVPVAHFETVRLVLALAAQKQWKVYQFDVKSAFLNDDLQEEVYVCQPPGFENLKEENKVYQLKKALYGLKQAPRAWYNKIDTFFHENGFERSQHEPTLYIKDKSMFDMTDLGELRYFLGLEISQTATGIFMCQKKYIEDTLKKFSMRNCKIAATPMNIGEKLSLDDDSGMADSTLYRSLVGRLIYVTHSRPDIAFSVGMVSRFMHKPSKHHFGSVDDRQSTSRSCFVLSSTVVSWSSKKQATVALSTTEAEYVAAATTACQAIWLRKVFGELGEEQIEATEIMCDNKSVVMLTRNPVLHARSKHIKIKHHFIRELIEKEEINLEHCKTEEQMADIMTKSLAPKKHEEFCSQLAYDLKYVSIANDDAFPNQISSLTIPQPVSLLDYISTLTSVNGLLCFCGHLQDVFDEKIAVLWNPYVGKAIGITISKSLRIPDGHTFLGFGVCPNTSDPKLVRINTTGYPTVNSEVEIFMLSTRVWKCVSYISPAFKTYDLIFRPVFVNGFIYWPACDNIQLADGIRSNLIISFELKSDEFGEVCLLDSDPKLVRINTIGYPTVNWEVEVFMLSTRVWKSVSHIPPAFKTCDLTFRPVFVNGFIYWPACDNIQLADGIRSNLIISFDLKSDEFGEEGVTKLFTKMLSIKAPDTWVSYRVLELRKNGEVIIENIDDTNSSAIEVYEPSSGHINGIGFYGTSDSFSMNSYMETLLLLDQSNSIIY